MTPNLRISNLLVFCALSLSRLSFAETTYRVVKLAQIDHSVKFRPEPGVSEEGFMMSASGQVIGRFFQGGNWHLLLWDKVHDVNRLTMPTGASLALFQTPAGNVYTKVTNGPVGPSHSDQTILYRLNSNYQWDVYSTADGTDSSVIGINSSGAVATLKRTTPFHGTVIGSDGSAHSTNTVLSPHVIWVTGPDGSHSYPPATMYLCDNGDLLCLGVTKYWPKGVCKIQSGAIKVMPSIVDVNAVCITTCSGSNIIVGNTVGRGSFSGQRGSYLWQGEDVTYFPAPEGGGMTLAKGVNRDVTIVGQIWKSNTDLYGYVQKLDGVQVDANTLLSPEDAKVWKIESLEGISDDGLLLGAARNADNGNKLYEIVLVPVK